MGLLPTVVTHRRCLSVNKNKEQMFQSLDDAIRRAAADRAAATGAATTGARREKHNQRRERQEARRPDPQRSPDPLGNYVSRWWGHRRALVQRNLALGVAVGRQDQLGPGLFGDDVRAQRDGGHGPLGNPYSMHVRPASGHRARPDESLRGAAVLANAFRARELARRNLAYLRGQTGHVAATGGVAALVLEPPLVYELQRLVPRLDVRRLHPQLLRDMDGPRAERRWLEAMRDLVRRAGGPRDVRGRLHRPLPFADPHSASAILLSDTLFCHQFCCRISRIGHLFRVEVV